MGWEKFRFWWIMTILLLMLVHQVLVANKLKVVERAQAKLMETCFHQNKVLKAHQEIIKKGVIEEMDYDVVFVD